MFSGRGRILIPMLTPEAYFILTVLASWAVKMLHPPVETWQEAISSLIAAFLCSYIMTDPLVSLLGPIGRQHPQSATLAIACLLSLTGLKLLQAAIRIISDTSATISPAKVLDIIVLIRTGGVIPPSRQLPPPTDEERKKGDTDDVQH